MADDPVLKQLKEAAKGLLYPSESDEPIDVFCWPADAKSSAKDQVATHAGAGKSIEEVTAESFFAELESADNADGFKRLQLVVQSQLTDAKILRAGAVRIDVYVIGRAKSGNWAGLHTVSVET